MLHKGVAHGTRLSHPLLAWNALRIEKCIDDAEKDLPELLIKELASDEIEAMRKAGREEEAIA
ncbi:hypothetical protein AT959_16100 [Dechloromonas denitrificans]|uniref:Uncharacterized protein n=1 Tax=Dechloromonas denitrificans TaxID=281362 RepID=A0A133XEV4_9RHOO|nr:hypothetical protein AT959_16100 [Dechloromonas denitrificans]